MGLFDLFKNKTKESGKFDAARPMSNDDHEALAKDIATRCRKNPPRSDDDFKKIAASAFVEALSKNPLLNIFKGNEENAAKILARAVVIYKRG